MCKKRINYLLVSLAQPIYSLNMSEKSGHEPMIKSNGEQLARFYRNWNAIWAGAFTAAAVIIPGPNVILGSVAALNAGQAVLGEVGRNIAANKRT